MLSNNICLSVSSFNLFCSFGVLTGLENNLAASSVLCNDFLVDKNFLNFKDSSSSPESVQLSRLISILSLPLYVTTVLSPTPVCSNVNPCLLNFLLRIGTTSSSSWSINCLFTEDISFKRSEVPFEEAEG